MQFGDGIGQIAHPQIGLAFQRPAGGFGQRAGFGRGMVARADDGGCAQHFRRPQNRAHVVRVGHTVQQNHPRHLRANRHIGQTAPFQRLDFHRGALVHRSGVQRRLEAARIDDFRLDPRLGNRLNQLVVGVQRHDKTQFFAFGVHQRIAHGMQAKQPDGRRRLDLFGLFLGHDPLGFFHFIHRRTSSVAAPRTQTMSAPVHDPEQKAKFCLDALWDRL